MQNQRRYIDFSVRDFICDEYFQEWVLRPDPEKEAFWQTWLKEHPEQETLVSKARLLLTHISFRTDRPMEGKAALALAMAWEKIDGIESLQQKQPVVHKLHRLWRMAAVWILVAVTAFFIYQSTERSGRIQVSTRYGQLDSLTLPDQSLVVLNANSSVQYAGNWKAGAPREVWLKGEAFFNVQHLDNDNRIEPSERFLVHVGRASIEVLGTSFNIRQRRDRIEIALLSGSISVHFDDNASPDIVMKPGELVIADTAFNNVKRTTTNTNNYTAWTQQRLVLNNPTLQEIVAYLEDTYGKKIVLDNPALSSRKVEGPILLDSLEDALFVLSTVLNVDIAKEGNTLIIRQR